MYENKIKRKRMKTTAYYCRSRFPSTVRAASLLVFIFMSMGSAAGGNMMDYFLPMPIGNGLESTGIWGAPGVIPRDIHNGLEDSSCTRYSYWDGSIIKGKDGKYYMYCSRWDQSRGHDGWPQSVAVYAVSDNITGPYVDQGLLYTHEGGRGHNVVAIELPDGRIAVFCSDIVPGWVFIADDPSGPFEFQGEVKINTNGYENTSMLRTNMSICVREDGTFLIIPRGGHVMHSTSGIMGPYLVKSDVIWPMDLPGFDTRAWEDPCVWRSGGKYYCMVNNWSTKQAIYLTSDDGLTNWEYTGNKAYSPADPDLFRYTDGTRNTWTKIERPGVYMENGQVTHLTFSVIDVEKEQDRGNDDHNSKIIVVPFDDADFTGSTATGSHVMESGLERPVSFTIKNTGAVMRTPFSVAGNATVLDMAIFDPGGRLIVQIDNAPVKDRCISLNHHAVVPALPQGIYLIVLRDGERCFQGRLMCF